MIPECECTFAYKTIKSYKAFEDYIFEKISTGEDNKINDNRISEGYLIDKNYLDFWKKYTDYENLKNKIEYLDYKNSKKIISKVRRNNRLKNYQADASQYTFLTPSSLYQKIKDDGEQFVLIDKNFWKLICSDEGLKEDGGMRYYIKKGKIIFVFGEIGKLEIFTNDNIINDEKHIIIKNEYKNDYVEENEGDDSEMKKLFLLYAFEQDLKNKINNLTYKENKFKKYYLISQEWIQEYKRYYHYNELCQMINNKNDLINILNKGYNWAKQNIKFALSKIDSRKPNQQLPKKLKIQNTFLSEGNQISINNNASEITYWKNFELINEELKNLFSNSTIHNYNFTEASYAQVLINEGKIILDLSNDENNEGNYAFEIGIIRNNDMIFNDEYIFQYNSEDSKKKHFNFFTNDIYTFQKENLDFDINLKCDLSFNNGNICGTAVKTP